MCSRDQRILYADDTVLVYVGKSLEEFDDHDKKDLLLYWYAAIAANSRKTLHIQNSRLRQIKKLNARLHMF